MDMPVGNIDALDHGVSKWCSFSSFHRKSNVCEPEIVTHFDSWKLSSFWFAMFRSALGETAAEEIVKKVVKTDVETVVETVVETAFEEAVKTAVDMADSLTAFFGSRCEKESSSRSAGPRVEEFVVLAQGARRRARAGQLAKGVKMDVEQAQLACIGSGFRTRRHT